MQITTLASGSSGNCYIVSNENSKVMIECGVPLRTLQKGGGLQLREIDACLISHGH